MKANLEKKNNDKTQKMSETQDFDQFIHNFKSKVKHAFQVRENIDQISLQRGLPAFVLREIMMTNPLSVAIPTANGGRGTLVHECLSILEAASYESLALSLTLGINIALFLYPVTKFADENVKNTVFDGFMKEKKMGGLMITEPDFGSNALLMQTSFQYSKNHYHLKGTKHWAGLTGMADYWLLTARQETESGKLQRDVDFFICDTHQPDQEIVVEEYFNNLGLYMIPYGRNRIDVKIPAVQRLQPPSTGIKLLLDTLHRSRLGISGMAIGFIKRILDEAIDHCKKRNVGFGLLYTYDQVQHRLSVIQAAHTICSAICLYTSITAYLQNDLTGYDLEANVAKTVTTDLMQESSQSLLQLVGAKGYRIDHISGRGTVDSRPFQIFEGSNDILYIQIAESVIKKMKAQKEVNLYNFTSSYFNKPTANYLKEFINVNLDYNISQRTIVDLGKAITKIVSVFFVNDLEAAGFNKLMIENARVILKQELSGLMATYHFENQSPLIENIDNSIWQKYLG